MFASKTLVALVASISVAQAQTGSYFQVSNLVATDIKIPAEEKASFISFTVSNPEANFEQGGNAPATCKFNWTTEAPPCCFTACQDTGEFSARITPGSFESAHRFKIDVVGEYAHRAHVRNNATFSFESGISGFWCSNGAQSDVCQSTGLANMTFVTDYPSGGLNDVC